MKDFCSLYATGLLTLNQANAQIKQAVIPVSAQEKIPINKAMGRVLAIPVSSPINIPSERTASMDGYAFSSADLRGNAPLTLHIIGTSWAGKPFTGIMQAGQCVRIFTGALVPQQADSVIMQEHVSTADDSVTFPPDTEGLLYIRHPGDDIKKDHELLPAGKTVTATDCALFASAGIYEITVKRKLQIAFFSTGDELTSLGAPLRSGQIFDSNRHALKNLLYDKNFSVSDLGVIRDNKQQLEQVLFNTSKINDVIISTGGASVGDADYVHEILSQCGQVNFWKIAMKPGKPLIFGKIGKSLFFGLPGNPVSVIVIFQKIVLPALQQLSGTTVKQALRIPAKCSNALKKVPGRQEYLRGILTQLETGEFIVEPAIQQDSHHLSALSKSNCYIVLAAECSSVETGETVTVEPFSSEI